MKEHQKNEIQEWFGDCTCAEEIAELYADLMYETKFQMQHMLSQYERIDG